MNDLIHPGAGLLYMKVGTHANEPLDEILARKNKEIEEAGVAFWGYGGNTCHPQTMVQPFVKAFEEEGKTIHLLMEKMESKHYAAQIRADEYSKDGINWEPIHDAIGVLGSRFALVIKGLRHADFEIPLNQTQVAIGNSQGRLGSKYIQGRVDKGCLEVLDKHKNQIDPDTDKIAKINLIAELVDPYAVFLRNRTC